jgi:hypothetical protein
VSTVIGVHVKVSHWLNNSARQNGTGETGTEGRKLAITSRGQVERMGLARPIGLAQNSTE